MTSDIHEGSIRLGIRVPGNGRYIPRIAIAENNALFFALQPARLYGHFSSVIEWSGLLLLRDKMFGARMNAETTPHCTALGFNDKRIQEVLSMFGLGAEHGAIAEHIRTQVIAGRADKFVDRCFATFARIQGFPLVERNIGAES